MLAWMLCWLFQISALSALAGTKDDMAALFSRGNQLVSTPKVSDYVENEVLVKFKQKAAKAAISVMGNGQRVLTPSAAAKVQNFASRYGLTMAKKGYSFSQNFVVLKIQDGESVFKKVARLQSDPEVEIAQPNYRYQLSSVNAENNARFGDLWGLNNTGQTVNKISGTAGADIHALPAWNISDGGAHEVVAAVVDTGVAYNHPDLAANMWNGSAGCLDENGDPIQGGCPHHGWDFDNEGDDDPAPGGLISFDPFFGTFFSYQTHGTHVAGTIAAVDNGEGVIGVAPRAKIMAVKTDALTTDIIVKGIAFAGHNGAKVINASWGGFGEDKILEEAIKNFPGLFIAAAGNFSFPAEFFFPCGFTLPNIICVAATDQDDKITDFSNFSTTAVHVGAPGNNILSSVPLVEALNDNFEKLSLPDLPADFSMSEGANWRSEDITFTNLSFSFTGSSFGKVVYGDSSLPYADNVDTALTSRVFDLSDAQAAQISFSTGCDTPFDRDNWLDFMALEATSDGGVSWKEIARWDEAVLNGPGKGGYGISFFNSFFLNRALLTENFQFRFRWVTDGENNNFGGCFVDSVQLSNFNRGLNGTYEFFAGTSMAAPHVVGLAALLWGTNDQLTREQVKDIIIQTGDVNQSLQFTTVSGRRINAENALRKLSVETPPALAIENISVTDITKNSATIAWTTTVASAGTLRYGINKRRLNKMVDIPLDTTHSVSLQGLRRASRYFFQITAQSEGQKVSSEILTFRTNIR